MYNERIRRVLDHLEGLGLGQALVCDPMSIKYLTGYYTFPHERFFALHLSPKGTTLFCNLLFPDATGHADRVVTFADTDDPLPLVAYGTEDFKRPVGLYNHADHDFWLGVGVSDLVADLRRWGERLTREVRGATASYRLTIPLDLMYSSSVST